MFTIAQESAGKAMMARQMEQWANEVISVLPEAGEVDAGILVSTLDETYPESKAKYNLPQLVKAGYIAGGLVKLENGNLAARFSRKPVQNAVITAKPTPSLVAKVAESVKAN